MRRLSIFCGAAQTRGLLQDNDRNIDLFFGPSIYDSLDDQPPPIGSIIVGRVLRKAPGFRGAFIDIGGSVDAFLSIKKSGKSPDEGAIACFKLNRHASGQKGPVVEVVERDTLQASDKKPGNILERPTLLQAMVSRVRDLEEIYIDNTEAIPLLPPLEKSMTNIGIPNEIYNACKDQIGQSLSRTIVIAGGGRVIFDETEGPTIIDIDGSNINRSANRASRSINYAAASLVMSEIKMREIGGRVVVDFLPPSSAKDKEDLVSLLKCEAKILPGVRLGRLQSDGLFDFTLPKLGPSLLEQATEKVNDGFVRDGLELSDHWIAQGLVFEIERRLKFGSSSLMLEAMISEKLKEGVFAKNPQWTKRISERYGLRIKFTVGHALNDWDYELHEG